MHRPRTSRARIVARSPVHAGLFGIMVMVLAACSALSGSGAGSGGVEVDPAAPPVERAVMTGEACGGLMGLYCAGEADYCHYEPEAQCGAADQMGICRTVSPMCTREYRPVCGCDGETYSNACVANAAGVSVAAMGACSG